MRPDWSSPPTITAAVGSKPRIASRAASYSAAYRATSGLGDQNVGLSGSFQISHASTGSAGSSGCSRQNEPPTPYREASAPAYAA